MKNLIENRVTASIQLLTNKISRGCRFLEIGCSNGIIIEAISNNFYSTDTYGVDIDEKALKSALERGVKVKQLNLNEEKLPYSNDYFDVVLFEEVIEHLVNPDNVLEEIFRVLKPKGYVLITTPNLGYWVNRLVILFGYQPFWTETSTKYNTGKFRKNLAEPISGHLRLYTLKALKELIRLYGFSVVKQKGITYEDTLPMPLNYFDNLFAKRAATAQIIVLLAQKP